MAGVKQYYGQSSSSLNERGSCSFDVTDPEALLRSWGSQRLWQLLPRSGGAELLHLQSERHISFMPIMMPHTVGAPASQGLCQLPPGGPPRHLGPQRGQAPPRTFGATARTVSAPAWRPPQTFGAPARTGPPPDIWGHSEDCVSSCLEGLGLAGALAMPAVRSNDRLHAERGEHTMGKWARTLEIRWADEPVGECVRLQIGTCADWWASIETWSLRPGRWRTSGTAAERRRTRRIRSRATQTTSSSSRANEGTSDRVGVLLGTQHGGRAAQDTAGPTNVRIYANDRIGAKGGKRAGHASLRRGAPGGGRRRGAHQGGCPCAGPGGGGGEELWGGGGGGSGGEPEAWVITCCGAGGRRGCGRRGAGRGRGRRRCGRGSGSGPGPGTAARESYRRYILHIIYYTILYIYIYIYIFIYIWEA